MCLSVPAKVESVQDQSAVVVMGNNRFTVSTLLLEEVKVNDFVLIHTGFAIELITKEDADEMVRLLREMVGYGMD